MYILSKLIHCLFPLIALVFLIIGIKKNTVSYVISSLWLSLIALVIHYQSSGSQILGSYFNYTNAAIYTLNLVTLFIALIRIISHLSSTNTAYKYISSLIQSLVAIGCLLVISNLWINAYFIESRMDGTPIMQVALLKKAEYCNYKYIFYKVAHNGSIAYLCPNFYGFIPSIGHLAISPDFIATQLPMPTRKQLLLLQQHKG